MYLVTGATGNIGRNVVAQLLEAGEAVRVFTRDPAKVVHWHGKAEIVAGDFKKPETLEPALAGVKGIFLMNRGLEGNASGNFLDAARAQAVPHIVLLSTLLAGDPQSKVGQLHHALEEQITAAGFTAKFLRPGSFMSNTFQWIPSIKAQGTVFNPMGTGQTAPIAPEDIAAIAVKALLDPAIPGSALELTGEEILSIPDQVRILSRVIGKPLSAVDISIEAAVEGMVRSGIPQHLASVVAQSFQAIRDGRVVIVRQTFTEITGSKPKTFETWATENAPRFA